MRLMSKNREFKLKNREFVKIDTKIFDDFKTHYYGCGRINKTISKTDQIKFEVGDLIVFFCDWVCFIENLGKLIGAGFHS